MQDLPLSSQRSLASNQSLDSYQSCLQNADIKSPNVSLTIAGSDSGGGAGIQADFKTFSALGVYGCSVITAITAQNTREVSAIHEVPAEIVAAQLSAVLKDISVSSIKIGMLSSATIIRALVSVLQDRAADIPIVLDPVMIAKSGDALLAEDAVLALQTLLLPMAHLLTPNLPEAARLLDCAVAVSVDEMRAQGRALLRFMEKESAQNNAIPTRFVLMKGGHLAAQTIKNTLNDDCVDLLIDSHGNEWVMRAPRSTSKNTHGTGCTLSSAIAAGLANKLSMPVAVEQAHAYLQRAIRAGQQLSITHSTVSETADISHGPVHHFHELWQAKTQIPSLIPANNIAPYQSDKS